METVDLTTHKGYQRTKRRCTATSSPRVPGKAIKPAQGSPANALEAYYDAPRKEYILRNAGGRWLHLNNEGTRRVLRSHGIATRPPQGELMSPADEWMLRIQNECDVQFAGPVAGWPEGFHTANGTRFLVTAAPKLIEPRQGEWPTVHAFLAGLLQDSEPEHGMTQLNTLHAWLKAATMQLAQIKHGHGQALALCGSPGCGKSLLQHTLITPLLGNRSAKAMRYMQGRTDFNLDLAGAEHLILDDEFSDLRADSRRALGANLKQMTVGTNITSIHGKNRNAVNLPVWWRVSISLNDEPEAMMVLPPLDGDVADKIILLRCRSFPMPLPMRTQEDKVRFREQIRAELPAYLWWLQHEFRLPPQLEDDRYGVASFHHPELVEALHGLSPEAQLLRLADEVLWTFKASEWRGTAESLRRILMEDEGTRNDARDLLRWTQSAGTYLGRLAHKRDGRVRQHRTTTTREWIIAAPSRSGD